MGTKIMTVDILSLRMLPEDNGILSFTWPKETIVKLGFYTQQRYPKKKKKKKSEAEIKTKRQAHAERMNLCWTCYARVFTGHSQVRRRRYLRS